MAEPSKSPELPDWIKNHISRYVATDGADGYLWDASIGGGKGMMPPYCSPPPAVSPDES